jgi:putative polyhydroxyalkanoate system protein
MADIRMTRDHKVEVEEMRSRVQAIVDEMQAKVGIKGSWRGDTCTISGKGIKKCDIVITPKDISFEVTLGMMFKMMKGQIQKQLTSRIDKLVEA